VSQNELSSARSARPEYSAPKILPPLSPLTYYRRNLARTLPVGGSIAISVFLIASIVTLLNSVDQSILVNYGFVSHFSVLATQFEKDVPPRVLAKAARTPRVGRILSAVPYFITIKTVFGQMPVPIYGVDPKDTKFLAELCGNRLAAGRWPRVNEPELVMSRAWAANKGVKLGQLVEVKNDRIPGLTERQKLVGILDGGAHFALADRSYLLLQIQPAFLRTSNLLIPKAQNQRKAMNADIDRLLKSPRHNGLSEQEANVAQFYTFEKLVKDLRETLGFLYTFLAVADTLVIGAVALLSGFLANIYFEQRLAEFGLLSAFGFRREKLARRLIIESGSLVIAGWLLGLLLTWLVFRALDVIYMAPRGLVLANIDGSALIYTLPAPLIVGAASLGTVLLRLYRLDPIEIMERR
jgi:ABC-type lipoprotein release transport system permease subunit